MSEALRMDIVPPSALSADERACMFSMVSAWFDGYGFDYFQQELDAADLCYVQRVAGSGEMAAFSTVHRRIFQRGDAEVGVFHTAHCIVARAHWGSGHVFEMIADLARRGRAEPKDRSWFLSYSAVGYRSYRYMPMLFREFLPVADCKTRTLDHDLRDRIGAAFFGDYYDPAAGVIDWNWPGYGLTPEARDISSAKLESAALRSLADVNPHWDRGVEILCLASLAESNLTGIGRRRLAVSPARPRR